MDRTPSCWPERKWLEKNGLGDCLVVVYRNREKNESRKKKQIEREIEREDIVKHRETVKGEAVPLMECLSGYAADGILERMCRWRCVLVRDDYWALASERDSAKVKKRAEFREG